MLLRTGKNRVPTDSAAMMSSSTPGWLPLARMTDSPACVTSRAARIFVRMPPVPSRLWLSPAIDMIFASTAATVANRLAFRVGARVGAVQAIHHRQHYEQGA